MSTSHGPGCFCTLSANNIVNRPVINGLYSYQIPGVASQFNTERTIPESVKKFVVRSKQRNSPFMDPKLAATGCVVKHEKRDISKTRM